MRQHDDCHDRDEPQTLVQASRKAHDHLSAVIPKEKTHKYTYSTVHRIARITRRVKCRSILESRAIYEIGSVGNEYQF